MFNSFRAPTASSYFGALYVSFVSMIALALLSVAFAMPMLAHGQTTPPVDESPVITPAIPQASVTVNPVQTTDGTPDAFGGISRDGWIALGIVAVAVLLIVVGWGMGGTNTTTVHRTTSV